MIAALSLGAGVGAGAVVSVDPGPERAPTCTVPSANDLRGKKLHVAKKMIRDAGCRGIIIVRNKCEAVELFGLVVKPSPKPRGTVSVNQRITLWRGIRQTEDGMICGELPDNTPVEPVVDISVYDGVYNGWWKPPNREYPLLFVVSDGMISRDIQGMIGDGGVTTSVTSVKTIPCTSAAGLTFTESGHVTGDVVCSLGGTTMAGPIVADRN
ncbi:MAG: PASTA domain-containing protein [Actinomycetota bacterium]|nr:PASTA domain-containing protein [Actinomycetota bacterium]